MAEPDWSNLFEKVGLPGLMLLALVYFGYRIANWLAANVFLPITNRHIEFLNNIEKSLENSERFGQKVIEVQSNMDSNIQKISSIQENMETCLQKITLCQEKLTVCVQVIEDKMNHGE